MRLKLSRIEPAFGAAFFGTLHFLAQLGIDWLFRSVIPDFPMPPLWSVLVTQAFGTAVIIVVVYYLLIALRRQVQAVGELNHELRNALQVFSYIVSQCPERDAEKGRAAVLRMTTTLERVSEQLGFEGAQWQDKPRKRA